MEFLRRLFERLGEQFPLLDDNRLLTALGCERHTLHSDDITKMKLLETREKALIELVALENELETVSTVVHGAEVHLAHAADHQQTAGRRHLLALLELLADLRKVIVRIGASIRPETKLFKFCHRRETVLAVFICLNFHLLSLEKPDNYTISCKHIFARRLNSPIASFTEAGTTPTMTLFLPLWYGPDANPSCGSSRGKIQSSHMRTWMPLRADVPHGRESADGRL